MFESGLYDVTIIDSEEAGFCSQLTNQAVCSIVVSC